MLLPEDFGIRIDYDENGLLVEVTHKPTGEVRIDHPTNQESVGAAQQRLISEIKTQFPASEEFRIDYLFVRDADGDSGTAIQVCHTPSGKTRYFPNGSAQVDIREAMDDIITELWHEERTKEINKETS